MQQFFKRTALAALFTVVSFQAGAADVLTAGGFVELPTSDPLRVVGNGSLSSPIMLGYDDTFSGNLPSFFVELASSQTTVVDAETGLDMGTLFDRVYRDSTDNKLVFATRLELGLDENGFNPFEVNDLQRAGFTGFSAAVAWWDVTGSDFYLKSAARSAQGYQRSSNGTGLLPDVFNADIVDMNTDTSGPEGNPLSGWYFIKTDATAFQWQADAVNVYTGNQDVAASVTNRWLAGYVAAVPEPSDFALLLVGLPVVVSLARRRQI